MRPDPLTEQQDDWFHRHCGPSQGHQHLPEGSLFYHGFRQGAPVLDNGRALWITPFLEEAADYAQAAGQRPGTGVLALRLSESLVLRRTRTSAARFLGHFDPGREWPDRHARYAHLLHAWGRWNHLPGLIEDHGSIVLFLAADYLEIVGNQELHLPGPILP